MRMSKLHLSNTDRKIAGVCGGIGESYDVDSTLIRLLWVFLTLVTGVIPGIILYLLAIIIIPEKPVEKIPPKPKDEEPPGHPLAEDAN
jgi:phage shock protein C